jgi:hypothetical protein
VAVTDTPSALPVTPTPVGGGRPSAASEAASPAAPARAREPAAAPAPAPAASSPPPVPQPIGLTLSYDDATHRLVLQAREPGSGFVIAQIPPSYVVKQFTTSLGGIAPARGGTVDSAA